MVRSELQLPTTALTFDEPEPGAVVMVRGRDARGPIEAYAEVVSDGRVAGILLRPSGVLDDLGQDQTGAGVYRVLAKGERRLVGLVSGRLTLPGDDDPVLTVVGPRDLWRLVTYHRNLERVRRPLVREDVL